jgi:peptidoglycan/LPS O-acetylase OafA/YrhL
MSTHSSKENNAMKILLRIVAAVLVLIAAFLIGIVISVGADPDTDLRIGVAVGYVIGGALLVAAAAWLWRYPARRAAGPAA